MKLERFIKVKILIGIFLIGSLKNFICLFYIMENIYIIFIFCINNYDFTKRLKIIKRK